MNYEKAYNEALERAKKVLLDCTSEERKAIEENIQSIYDIADTVYERSKERKEYISSYASLLY